MFDEENVITTYFRLNLMILIFDEKLLIIFF